MNDTLPNASTLVPQVDAQQGEQLPHGLRGLLSYPFSWEDAWPWLLALLVLLLVLGLLFYLWKKNQKSRPAKVEAPEDPFRVLERQLQNLQPPDPFLGKQGVQFFFELNMLLRQFLELCSGLAATDLTLQELKEPLRTKSPLSRETTEDLIRFLERSESIKFANVPTDLAEARQSYTQVQEWVSYMRPKRLESESR